MLTVSIFSLYRLIGVASLTGVGVIGVSLIYNLVVSRWIMRIEERQKKANDKRMEITT